MTAKVPLSLAWPVNGRVFFFNIHRRSSCLNGELRASDLYQRKPDVDKNVHINHMVLSKHNKTQQKDKFCYDYRLKYNPSNTIILFCSDGVACRQAGLNSTRCVRNALLANIRTSTGCSFIAALLCYSSGNLEATADSQGFYFCQMPEYNTAIQRSAVRAVI